MTGLREEASLTQTQELGELLNQTNEFAYFSTTVYGEGGVVEELWRIVDPGEDAPEGYNSTDRYLLSQPELNLEEIQRIVKGTRDILSNTSVGLSSPTIKVKLHQRPHYEEGGETISRTEYQCNLVVTSKDLEDSQIPVIEQIEAAYRATDGFRNLENRQDSASRIVFGKLEDVEDVSEVIAVRKVPLAERVSRVLQAAFKEDPIKFEGDTKLQRLVIRAKKAWGKPYEEQLKKIVWGEPTEEPDDDSRIKWG